MEMINLYARYYEWTGPNCIAPHFRDDVNRNLAVYFNMLIANGAGLEQLAQVNAYVQKTKQLLVETNVVFVPCYTTESIRKCLDSLSAIGVPMYGGDGKTDIDKCLDIAKLIADTITPIIGPTFPVIGVAAKIARLVL